MAAARDPRRTPWRETLERMGSRPYRRAAWAGDLDALLDQHPGDLTRVFEDALDSHKRDLVMELLERAEDRLPRALSTLMAKDADWAIRNYPRPLTPEELQKIADYAMARGRWNLVAELLRQGFVGSETETLGLLRPSSARRLLTANPPKDPFISDMVRLGANKWNTLIAKIALPNHGELASSLLPDDVARNLGSRGVEFTEFEIDAIPFASNSAVLGVHRSRLGEADKARYLGKLLARGNDLGSYFASRDNREMRHHPEVLEAVYQPEYATAALLNALVTGNQEVVRWLEGKGVRVANPELFRP